MAEVITGRGVVYHVAQTGPTVSNLPPVRLAVDFDVAPFRMQDYLEPEDAERLAAELMVAAVTARDERRKAAA